MVEVDDSWFYAIFYRKTISASQFKLIEREILIIMWNEYMIISAHKESVTFIDKLLRLTLLGFNNPVIHNVEFKGTKAHFCFHLMLSCV